MSNYPIDSSSGQQRITKYTTADIRQAVVTSFVRNDLLGILEPRTSHNNAGQSSDEPLGNEDADDIIETPWERLQISLCNQEPNVLGQSTARLLSTLASFPVGRNYLARWDAESSSQVTKNIVCNPRKQNFSDI